MIHVPWLPASFGTATSAMVELIDLFPTLQELAGFAVSPELEGVSQAALLTPSAAAAAAGPPPPPRKVALAQFPRCVAPGSEPPSQYWDRNNCNSNTTDEYTVMGHTMRTADGWRFTRWVLWNQTSLKPEWSSQDFGEELYDFRDEPLLGDFDMQSDNLVADPAHTQLAQELRRQLEVEFSKKHSSATLVKHGLSSRPQRRARKTDDKVLTAKQVDAEDDPALPPVQGPRFVPMTATQRRAQVAERSARCNPRNTTVIVSCYGFDPVDSTEFLQAALDSGARKVIVPPMCDDSFADCPTSQSTGDHRWITLPLHLRSNQVVIFESGVQVWAKRWEYTAHGDSVLNIEQVSNVDIIGYGALISMHKADYANHSVAGTCVKGAGVPCVYSKAEWRMCINMIEATNVSIAGLTVSSSGGDQGC
jgi:hypothetical protein